MAFNHRFVIRVSDGAQKRKLEIKKTRRRRTERRRFEARERTSGAERERGERGGETLPAAI